MADGMTKGEIEDVLSSIRRLVSDENRPVFRAAPRPYAREAEKLILTPALRVQPPDDPAEDPEAPSRFVLTEKLELPPDRPKLDSLVTAIAAAVPPQVEGWESETGDPIEPLTPARNAGDWMGGLAARITLTEPEATSSVEIPDAGTEPPQPADLHHVAALEQTAAAAPAAASAPTQTWQVEGDDGWDLDDAVLDPSDPVLEAPDAAALPSAEAPILADRAALTELIREILREELRGPLGERITGNLRKLVRAEIARALALRDGD